MAAEIVHHPSPGKTEERESEDACGMKRKVKLRFSLTMLSEEDLETGGHQDLSHPQTKSIDEDIEDDCFDDVDQLLVSLATMSFNLVDDQGPDTDKPFYSCDHQFNEVVVTPEQADLGIISTQIGKLNKDKEQKNLFLKSKSVQKYIASGQYNQICLEDTMSAKITIFRFMPTKDTQSGVPVVLNFTGTENFFCCTNEGEEKILKITWYDKSKLNIPGDDPKKTALVFYMSITPSGHRHFESVLHRGWFIHTVDSGAVKMIRGALTSSTCFDLIESDATKTFQI
ncbi:uncharacterized protein si:ch73-226l13.2 [Rhinichthys klamathensis goyatoka]|uniref:uncharacterized protein si:ch73-226l13.2 n=1 Tax=Rhinichthys klamathensis goyatoka TaxID=3034132 RepID=UPI0024B4A4CE|nr:uncharacterized protein si:ch73-226l13.2 [Rhinichthys klamathensis goyatoka]